MFDKDQDHIPLLLDSKDIVLYYTELCIYSQEIDSDIHCCIDRIFRRSFAPVYMDKNYRIDGQDDRTVRSCGHDWHL